MSLATVEMAKTAEEQLNAVREVLLRHGADPESRGPLDEIAERLIAALVRELGATQRMLAQAEEAGSRR
jgi:hypothetical protein